MKVLGLSILLAASLTGTLHGAELVLQPESTQLDPPVSIAFSRDSSNPILVVGFSDVRHSKVWHINDSRVTTSLRPRRMDELTSVAVSPDARYWAEGGVQGLSLGMEIGFALLHETDRPEVSGKTLWRGGGYSAPGERVTALAFSHDGKGIFLGRSGGQVDLFSVGNVGDNSYKAVAHHNGKITGLDISSSGTCVIASDDGTVSLITKDGSHHNFTRERSVRAIAVTLDGKRLVTATERSLRIWNVQTKRRLYELSIGAKSITMSPTDPNTVLYGCANGKWGRIDLRTGTVVGSFAWPGQEIIDMDISPDGRLVAIASPKGCVALWTMKGIQVARLWHFGNTWVVADRDSRFNSNNLRKLEQVNWNYGSTQFPFDVFMARRHQVDLLRKIYHQDPLPPLEDISDVNFAQPIVKIKKIRPDREIPTQAIVQIEVSSTTRIGFTGKKLSSGARNLRLFRDNQLTRQIDGDLLKGSGTQARTYEFKVQVVNRQTEFMAYAFSDTGIKSETATQKLDINIAGNEPKLTRTGNFYLLSMGVNNYSMPNWNLHFAVNDGRELQRALMDALENPERRLVSIGLYSDDTDRLATKDNFKNVLDILAGRTDLRESDLFGATGLARAQPKDTVLLAFAGHGYIDENGIFYMFPGDIGTSSIIDAHFLRHGISSIELASWLRDVDAGTIVLLIDACHSAGSIDSAGFRPVPLDSAGLGQLAYDKNMLILAASQASNLALEDDRLQHGLLSYALVQEGLIQRKADHNPLDGRIDLREWLYWSRDRVPALYQDLQDGKVIQPGTRKIVALRDKSRDLVPKGQPFYSLMQQPVLFDFSKIPQDCPYTIWKGPNARDPSCGTLMAPTLKIISN